MKIVSKSQNNGATETDVALSPIRVKRATFEKMTGLLAKVNQKELGRRVRSDDLIGFALALVTEAHVKELQDSSLSNHDRFEAMYKDHVAKKGSISKDAYLGMFLNRKTNISGGVSA